MKRPSALARGLVGATLWLLRAAPQKARVAFAAFIGWLAWTLRIRRAVASDNLALAFPDLPPPERTRIARGAFASLAQAMLESITSDLVGEAELERLVRVPDWKGLDRLLDARQPVLIASAHLGSWELFAEVMARRGCVFSAVVRPLSGAFNEWLVRNRERAGVELILQRGALRGMLRALKRSRAVVQLVDQALPGNEAVWVPFFGHLAATTPALSMAAVRSGAPVYFVVAVRTGDHFEMHVDGPLPVPQAASRREAISAHVAQLTALVERSVRRSPEQWLWLHRRWKRPAQIARRKSTPA